MSLFSALASSGEDLDSEDDARSVVHPMATAPKPSRTHVINDDVSDDDDMRSEAQKVGGMKDKVKDKKFVKFKAELAKNRREKEKSSGITSALNNLALKKKQKNKLKKMKKTAQKRLETEHLEESTTETESEEEGDSDQEKEEVIDGAGMNVDIEIEKAMTDYERVLLARESGKVSVTTLDGTSAENLYQPVSSFSQLTQYIPVDVLEACLGTIPAYQNGNYDSVKPSLVQSECWGATLGGTGRDIIAISYTGSGKTLGFLVPTFAQLLLRQDQSSLEDHSQNRLVNPQALVVAPTRELALQIAEVATAIGEHRRVGMRVFGVVGGVGFEHQRSSLITVNPQLLISTPGRLLALCGIVSASSRKTDQPPLPPAIALHNLSSLVLDEADRLLDMGFEPDIHEIASLIATRGGESRSFLDPLHHPRVILTSATWAENMNQLALQLVQANALKILIGQKDLAAASTITQVVEVLNRKGALRQQRLCSLLRLFFTGKHDEKRDDESSDSEDEFKRTRVKRDGTEIPCGRVLVFVLFKKEAAMLSDMLNAKGFKTAYLHGDMSQKQRSATLEVFTKGEVPILVATDVAARGLDVKDITHVINYSMGLSVDHYIHRIGRCGRAGGKGHAHTFFVDYDRKFAPELVIVLEQADQPVPQDLRDLASKWMKKKNGGATRGEAAWGCEGGVELTEEQIDELEARRLNREKQMSRKFGHQKNSKSGKRGGRKGKR